MHFVKVQAILLISLAVTSVSCRKTTGSHRIREGYVEYQITYLENATNNVLTQQMPDKMTMKFRDNMSVNEIEGFFGFFELCNIADLKKGTNTTMLKVLDKKYFYLGEPDEKPCCFDTMDGMQIEYLDETKTIAGYLCQKARITFPGKDTPPFVIYYTSDIQVEDPNRTNPFGNIDGVLMEFEIKLRNLRMRLQAYNVVGKKLSDKEFDIPSDYLRISKKDMEQIVEKLLN